MFSCLAAFLIQKFRVVHPRQYRLHAACMMLEFAVVPRFSLDLPVDAGQFALVRRPAAIPASGNRSRWWQARIAFLFLTIHEPFTALPHLNDWQFGGLTCHDFHA